MTDGPVRVAVVGAGPVGLALALLAAQALPAARVTVYDARPAGRDLSADPRTLALALGSVQLLQRLGGWPAQAAAPITEVHVSQVPPAGPGRWSAAEVRIAAAEQRVPMLGAVLAYGPLVQALERAWHAAEAAAPQRLASRFGHAVTGVEQAAGGVTVTAAAIEAFDLAVVAEGGVFAEQPRKPLARDYGQTAWVGEVELQADLLGVAFERFTQQGPLALLPLPPAPGRARRAALVWCVARDDDPVRDLDDAQRAQRIGSLLPAAAPPVAAVGALKSFALGLNAERTLVDRRVVRIGNAAQTLHPVAGQGLNLGLRDAWSLVDALRFAGGVDAALRRVEWARAGDRWATIATTDLLARSFTWQGPGLGAMRGAGLALLQALPPLKALLARQMMFGWR